MANMSEQMDPLPQDDLSAPETPQEHRVCKLTVFGCIAFIAACAYYLLTPHEDGLRTNLIIAAGVFFALTLLNFFRAAFCGRLCGKQNGRP